ncbi:MAG: hypothetical protein HZA54_14965, partial [Planctomycetes bacterium]|nr:hypothetical protein [Planctomycetota bacterium]
VAALGALGVAYAAGWAVWGPEAVGPRFHGVVTLALAVGALAAAAALAGGTIAAEKESRLLEEFALLGQVKHRYVYGKFFGVFWLSLLLGAPAFVHALALAGRISLLPALVLLLVLPPALAGTVAHGLWFSLRARTAARGMAASLLALPPLLLAPPCSLIPWLLLAPPGFEQYICMLPIALVVQPLWLRLAAKYVRWVLTQTVAGFDAALQAHLESRVG